MSTFLKSLLVGATVTAVAASTAFAQSTDTTETQADTATTEQAEGTATAPRADGLSTGETIIQPGQTFKVSEHGDWELRCIKAPEGQKDPCQLYQLLEDQQGNSVAEINLFTLPEGDQLAAGATIVTPLQTLLTKNVLLSVDGGQAKVYPFTFCTEIGCFSRVGFTAGDIASFKAGNAGKIVVVPAQAPDQTVELTMSLKGFTAGLAAVQEISK